MNLITDYFNTNEEILPLILNVTHSIEETKKSSELSIMKVKQFGKIHTVPKFQKVNFYVK